MGNPNPPSSGRYREGFSPASIFPDEYLDFTSGDQDPLFDISQCNIPQQPCSTAQTNSPSFSSHHDGWQYLPSHHGQQPISWDLDLALTTADSSSALLGSSLPLSSTSSFPALISTYDTFYGTATCSSLSL